MSWETFDDDCLGCRPAIIAPDTGKVLPQDHPAMVAVTGAWNKLSTGEKEAWHRFTCQNSRALPDLILIEGIKRKFQQAILDLR